MRDVQQTAPMSRLLQGDVGSGKTAVGKQLGRMLKVPFYDSDAEVERRTGVDIPFIFEREGEAGFRAREREAIEAQHNKNEEAYESLKNAREEANQKAVEAFAEKLVGKVMKPLE